MRCKYTHGTPGSEVRVFKGTAFVRRGAWVSECGWVGVLHESARRTDAYKRNLFEAFYATYGMHIYITQEAMKMRVLL